MAWSARLRNGVVQYAAVSPPSVAVAARQLRGLDGGDWRTGLSAGHPDRSADGGDFASGALVVWPMAQLADGGDFSR